MHERGYIASLFDLSFSSFVTSKIVKVLYVLSIIALGLWAIFFVLFAFSASTGSGVIALLIGAPLFLLITLSWSRVILEVLIVQFRIAENIEEIAVHTRAQAPSSETPPLPSTS